MKIFDVFLINIKKIEYNYIMGIVGYILSSDLGQKRHKKAVDLVTKLIAQKKTL